MLVHNHRTDEMAAKLDFKRAVRLGSRFRPQIREFRFLPTQASEERNHGGWNGVFMAISDFTSDNVNLRIGADR